MRCLDIGPGPYPAPGFETLDIHKSPGVTHVGDCRKPPFKAGTFDIVHSSHCIEHVHWYEVEDTIREWVRILKPGGALEVWTLNAYPIMKCLVELEESGDWTGPKIGTWREGQIKGDPYKWAVGRILNYVKKSNGEHNLHRAILTPCYMMWVFDEAGLTNIRQMDRSEVRGRDHGWVNMGFRGEKPLA